MLDALPPALRERTRVLAERPVADGRFVLYWMHHAMRTDENPALDVARMLADDLNQPLLVVQGLGGAHPYSNDRHHFFALQCARDVARELATMGIAYRFHLTSRHGRAGDLARQASAIVLEEMPVPPMRGWQQTLAANATAPVVAVDTRCVVPMTLVPKRFDRAFAFRKAVSDDLDARLLSSYPLFEAKPRRVDETDLAGAYDVASADDAQLLRDIARLDIDHSVAPVFETPGGTRAAEARWNEFAQRGLSSYHELRNDAAVDPPHGVSRLSPFLHYGCLSPLRVAREAAQSGGKGAEKFLDELIIWRELAHNFCYHTPGLNTLAAIPEWARDTLLSHADDPRPALHSWDTLAHARTGEPLWDRAQRSLLLHGELHNNVRMTWAKQLLQWTDSPSSALAMLLDLNHRYALDGSDPNSYGGLLWAMGQFDRPFKPAVPVLGTVRPRSLGAHARRLDQAAWGRRVDRPSGAALRVAVVGAGASGAAAARTLTDHGHSVETFEKSRGAGGRMATRRVDAGTFDHGAQYFSVRDAAFARRVRAWRQDGWVAPWPARLVRLGADGSVSEATPADRFTFVPGMNALAQQLLGDVALHTNVQIERMERRSETWSLLTDDDRAFDGFDAVVMTPPAHQTRALLSASALAVPDCVAHIDLVPCHAAMLTLPAHAADFDAAFVDDDVIAWIACDSSKPGRRTVDGLAHWVVHATEAFSREYLESDKTDIARRLGDAVARRFATWPEPLAAHGHRWRYARVEGDTPQPSLAGALSAAAAPGIWLAGDALAGTSRVEGAWQSGVAAAARVMAEANH